MAAAVTELVAGDGVTPLVTGGTSVDLYAAGALEEAPRYPQGWQPSLDVDLVNLASDSYGGATTIRRRLHAAGFVPAMGDDSDVDRERGWRHPDVPVAIEVIGGAFEGAREKVVELDVDGHTCHVRGPEDTLWEHLEWAAHTGDQRSWTRALAIAKAQRETLDVPYLRRLAEERGFAEALDACLRSEPLD